MDLMYNYLDETVESDGVDGLKDTELVEYDFATLKVATTNFSNDNKLGEGGFGAVYKVLVCLYLYVLLRYISETLCSYVHLSFL